MEREIHNKLRRRIHEVIAERGGFTPAAHEPEGGFLPLLAAAAPMVAPLAGKAMGWLGEKLFGSGDEEFDGAGDFYGEGKRAKRPANAHAQKVKELMDAAKEAGTPLSFIDASKLAANKQVGGAKSLKGTRKPRKAAGAAPAKGRKPRTGKAAGAAPAKGRKPRKAPGAAAKPRKVRAVSYRDVMAKALQSDWAEYGAKISLKMAQEAVEDLLPLR